MELPISDKCCDKLKKEPLRRKAKELGLECAILGILASESYQRLKKTHPRQYSYFSKNFGPLVIEFDVPIS